MENQKNEDVQRVEYTVRNYDAVNRAVESHAQIIESKAGWFYELVREIRTRRILFLTIAVCAALLSIGVLIWLYSDTGSALNPISISEPLTKEERRDLADRKSMQEGTAFVLFREVEHPLGEDVVTGYQYIYPDIDNPVDQWCYLKLGGDEISRYATDRSGIYDRSTDEELLQFEDGCRFSKD